MRFNELRNFVQEKLKNGLSPDLTYHCPAHTDDVMNAAEQLASSEGIQGDDLILLLSSALLHDTGFLMTYRDHESSSVLFAKEHLPGFGYDNGQIDSICEMIIATRIPQSPVSFLGEVLCDADLDYLGRGDYEPIAGSLFAEFRKYGVLETEEQWLKLQIDFLSKHKYFTRTAILNREPGKQQQIQRLRAMLG